MFLNIVPKINKTSAKVHFTAIGKTGGPRISSRLRDLPYPYLGQVSQVWLGQISSKYSGELGLNGTYSVGIKAQLCPLGLRALSDVSLDSSRQVFYNDTLLEVLGSPVWSMPVKCTLAKVLFIFGTMFKNIVTLLSIFMKTSELMYFFMQNSKLNSKFLYLLRFLLWKGGRSFFGTLYSVRDRDTLYKTIFKLMN